MKPNKVDFLADAKLFLTFVDNPVVVTTVATILGVYAVAAVWAHRKDKKDEEKVTFVNFRVKLVNPWPGNLKLVSCADSSSLKIVAWLNRLPHTRNNRYNR